MKVAAVLASEALEGVKLYRGDFFLWFGARWRKVDRTYVEDLCWQILEDAHYLNAAGAPVRWKPTIQKIGNVVRALEACSRTSTDRPTPHLGPGWLGWAQPEWCITFEDIVVDVKQEMGRIRDIHWFEPNIIPFPYDPKAPCPLWQECLDQWSCSDPSWKNLLQRWFGYCLTGDRTLARWLLMHGKVRSGKGTISRVLQSLCPHGFIGTDLYRLAERFGLWGLEASRVLCIHEVSRMDNRDGERCAMVLKSILGQDPMDIDRKSLPLLRNVLIGAAPMVQANEIPRLPNKGQGLSSKMLVLPFDHSFAGHEDPHLFEKLRGELPGIAAWALAGAHDIAHSSTPQEAFPPTARGEEAARIYKLVNNPYDSFLESRFVPDSEGLISYRTLWRMWTAWAKENRLTSKRVSRDRLPQTLIEQSTWDLKRVRPHGGERCLKGLCERKSDKYQEVG